MQMLTKDGSAIVQGFVTNSAETKYVGSKQTKMTKFSLIVGKKEDGSGIFVNCVAFSKAADCSENLIKGDCVFAIGKIQTSEYTGNDGNPKTSKSLNIDFLTLMGNSTQETQKTYCAPPQVPQNANLPKDTSGTYLSKDEYAEINAALDDDLPF